MEDLSNDELMLMYQILEKGKPENIHTARVMVGLFDRIEKEALERNLIKKEV